MASYAEAAMMSQHSPPHTANMLPQYPPPPDSSPPNNAPFPPQIYPNTDPALHPAPVPISQTPSNQKPPKGQGQSDSADGKEYRNRLRKACDSCSIRKVKVSDRVLMNETRTLPGSSTDESSVTRLNPARRVAHLISRVPLSGRVRDEDLQIGTQTRSRSSGWKQLEIWAHLQTWDHLTILKPPLPLTRLKRSLLSLDNKSYPPSLSRRGMFCNISLMTTFFSSILSFPYLTSHHSGLLLPGERTSAILLSLLCSLP